MPIDDSYIISLMKKILVKQGKNVNSIDRTNSLRELGFRSMDFSELCLRVEEESGKELNFEAITVRTIETVADVCDFLKDSVL